MDSNQAAAWVAEIGCDETTVSAIESRALDGAALKAIVETT